MPNATPTTDHDSDTGDTTATATLEHINVTVSDPERTAQMLTDIFGWEIRWEGPSQMGGRSIHVGLPGTGESYLAIYTFETDPGAPSNSYGTAGGLNHIAMMVDDLDATEARIVAAGYETHTHGDYEPGRRFYFHDHDNIEFEVVSYS